MFLNIGQVLYWNYNICFISNVECNLAEVKGFRFNVELIWLSNIAQVSVVNCSEIHSIPRIL